MLKPICVKCQLFFRPEKTGVCFVEAKRIERNGLPGVSEPRKWEPYKLWSGDLWKCRGCGVTIISGVGNRPISEHFEGDFNEKVKKFYAEWLQVNDC